MTTDPVREQLQALPEPALPDELWLRLSARHTRRAARLKTMRNGILMSALALGIFWLTPLPQWFEPEQATTQQSNHPAPDTPADSRILTIDRALQAAYARGATDEEIAPLWAIRERMAPTPTRSPTTLHSS